MQTLETIKPITQDQQAKIHQAALGVNNLNWALYSPWGGLVVTSDTNQIIDFINMMQEKHPMPLTYLAGPMTGIKDYNYPQFNQAAQWLRAQGHNVINPDELHKDTHQPWAHYMRADIKALANCNTIAMLPGWVDSKGARLEQHIATLLEMETIYLTGNEWAEVA